MHNRSRPTKHAQAVNAIATTATDICQRNRSENFHAPTRTKFAYNGLHPPVREHHSLKSTLSYMLSEVGKAIMDEETIEMEAARERAKKAREEARRYDKQLDELLDAVTDLRDHVKRVKMNLRELKDDLTHVDARVTEEFADLNRRVTNLGRRQGREKDGL